MHTYVQRKVTSTSYNKPNDMKQYCSVLESILYVTSYTIIRCTNIITPRGNQRLFVLAFSVRRFSNKL